MGIAKKTKYIREGGKKKKRAAREAEKRQRERWQNWEESTQSESIEGSREKKTIMEQSQTTGKS